MRDNRKRSQTPREAYGEELKRRREAAGLTQQSLAELVICSPSLIAHIEAGRRKPRPDDAKRLDQALGTDGFFVRFLPTLERARFADYFVEAAEFETQATVIREYAASLVPGILQTTAYARAVLRAGFPPCTPEDVDSRVVNRLQRAQILKHPLTPLMLALIDEAVIRRVIGGPGVMAEQLRHIVDLGRSGRVRVHVLPFSVGEHALIESMVSLMRFPDAPPVAYVEGVSSGQLIEEPAAVDQMNTAYDLALGDALSLKESLGLLEAVAEEYDNGQQGSH